MRQSRRHFFLAAAAFSLLATPASAEGGSHGQVPPDRQQRLTSADSYIPMPTLSAAVIQQDSTRGTLVVDMGIDIQDATLRGRAGRVGPPLRDALRTALSTYANVYYRDRTAPDPTTLTRLMQTAVDRTLGAPGARVLLTNILYQRRTS